jgi:hypothetical protein
VTKALVVFESMFGNTEQIAQAVAEGLRASMPVEVTEVINAPADPPADISLIVVGGPTEAFSMSRATTRADAVRQGGRPGREELGLREWLTALPSRHRDSGLATFDTKIDKMRHLPGSAAKGAAKAGRHHGLEVVIPPESFFVHDTAGPLIDGELDRARAWGRRLGELMRPSESGQAGGTVRD